MAKKQRRKKLIYTASKLILNGNEHYSCIALRTADCWSAYSCGEAMRYAEFYQRRCNGCWFDFKKTTFKHRRSHRLLLLALYAEVGLEGIGL